MPSCEGGLGTGEERSEYPSPGPTLATSPRSRLAKSADCLRGTIQAKSNHQPSCQCPARRHLTLPVRGVSSGSQPQRRLRRRSRRWRWRGWLAHRKRCKGFPSAGAMLGSCRSCKHSTSRRWSGLEFPGLLCIGRRRTCQSWFRWP